MFFGMSAHSQEIIEKYTLPLALEETSGLTLLNSTLWTHNDSDNEAALYAISTKGVLLKKIALPNKSNIDWEDITAVNGNLVIADMGNNFGTRKNLYLLEVIPSENSMEVFDSIPFHYPEQNYYGFQLNTPFDAEGLIAIENNLVVFTKNRKTQTTELYIVSCENEGAKKIGSLAVGSLITGADYNAELKMLVLTGYGKNFQQYLYVIRDFNLSLSPKPKINQVILELKGAQVEAVAIIDSQHVWITSEKTFKHPALLAKIKLE